MAARGAALTGLTEAQLAGREPSQDFVAFVVSAIANDQLLPDRLPSEVKSGQPISLTACPGEYESASLALYGLADLPEVRFAVSDLRSPTGTIPASALDLWVAKVWYQAGCNVGFQNESLRGLPLRLPALLRPCLGRLRRSHLPGPQRGLFHRERRHSYRAMGRLSGRVRRPALPGHVGALDRTGPARGGAAAEWARRARLKLLRMPPDGANLGDLRREMIADILALQ